MIVPAGVALDMTMPFPPSVNTYWRTFRGRMLISKRGRDYCASVVAQSIVAGRPTVGTDAVTVYIRAYMPDAKRRDVDNLLKCPLDALAHAGVYLDDSQIRKLTIENCGIDRAHPRLEVKVERV